MATKLVDWSIIRIGYGRVVPEVPVEVCSAVDPAGRLSVLLQLPDGYIVMQPDGARELAALLVEVADEVEGR